MSIPDFERAEYTTSQTIEGEVIGRPLERRSTAAFPLALLYGAVAALIGSIGYAMVWSLGFMISIIAVGIAWIVVKAMMTASAGVGGRKYQIAAVLFTYFAVSCGRLFGMFWTQRLQLIGLGHPLWFIELFAKRALTEPFLALSYGFNGIIGIVILLIGMRAAWRWAAGSPGFSGTSRTRPVDPFGLR